MSRAGAVRLVVVGVGLAAGAAAAWPWHAEVWDRLFGERPPAQVRADAEGTEPPRPAGAPAAAASADAPVAPVAPAGPATPAEAPARTLHARGEHVLEVPLQGRGEEIQLAPGVKGRLQLHMDPDER